jgi:hypothetical protein
MFVPQKALRFKPEHESMLREVEVISTTTPRWSAENRTAWGHILLSEATRELKPQQRRNATAEGFDLSKFGMSPQFVPLPAVQLIWPALRRIFWYRPLLADLLYRTRIMVAALEYVKRTTAF